MTLRELRAKAILSARSTRTRLGGGARVNRVGVSSTGLRFVRLRGTVEAYLQYADDGESLSRAYSNKVIEIEIFGEAPNEVKDEDGDLVVAQLRYFGPRKADPGWTEAVEPFFSLEHWQPPALFESTWSLTAHTLALPQIEIAFQMFTNASVAEHRRDGSDDTRPVPINEVELHWVRHESR